MSDQSPATTAAPRAVLRRLADVRSETDDVLSVYIDLDPTVFPTPNERHTEINSLMGEAEAAYLTKDLNHDDKKRRIDALDRVNETLKGHRQLASGGTRSVALFASPSLDLFKVVELPTPVAPAVIVDSTPYIRPVANEAGPRTWGVLLADKRHARIMYGGARRLVEVADLTDDAVRSRPSYGGWSQARYQRHHEDAVREHLEDAIETLADFYDHAKFDALAVASPEETYHEVVERLPSRLSDILCGRIRVEIDFPSPAQVLDAAQDVFDEARTTAIEEALTHLEERNRDLVMTQTEDVLLGLLERRVMTLVVKERAEFAGVRCPQCSWLALRGQACPFDNTPTEDRSDLVDDAIDMALLQSARVIVVPEEAERQPPADLSALLRF